MHWYMYSLIYLFFFCTLSLYESIKNSRLESIATYSKSHNQGPLSCLKDQTLTLVHLYLYSGLVFVQRGRESDKPNCGQVRSIHPADGSGAWRPVHGDGGCCHQSGCGRSESACQPASQWVTQTVSAAVLRKYGRMHSQWTEFTEGEISSRSVING